MKKIMNTVFTLAAMACVIVALVMLTQPAMVFKGKSDAYSYTLANVTLGTKIDGQQIFKMSFLNMVPYILLIAAFGVLVVQLAAPFVKSKDGQKLSSPFTVILCMAFCIGAGVMFLYTINFIEPYTNGLTSEMVDIIKKGYKECYELGSGAITAAACSFICSGLVLGGQIILLSILKDNKAK